MPRTLRTSLAVAGACLLALGNVHGEPAAADPAADESPGIDTAAVNRLIGQLAAGSEQDRSSAKEALLALGRPDAADAERLLLALPKLTDSAPAAIREGLAEVRRELFNRLAKLSAEPTTVTLDVVQSPLSEVLTAIEEQTGNKVIDLRDQFGQEADDKPVSLTVTDIPFWDAMDQVLDEAGMTVYSFSGERALGIMGRGGAASSRWAAGTYAGPLRIEPIRVTASRDLRQINGESLNVQLEVSWEPRLTPIALTQPRDELEVIDDTGAVIEVSDRAGDIELEVQAGGQTVEMTLPMKLPARGTQKIESLRGRLNAVMPSGLAEFRFDKLDEFEEPPVQQKGGATVTLIAVQKNGELWDLHMRLRIEDAGGEAGAFASHRGWVLENPTYLVDEAGAEIEHQGFETTMQRGNEIGLAYQFELPEGPAGLTWVYKTPTAILETPLEYELNFIPLP
ncbi:MAG: hypothetical protein AAGJ46_16340 [Planctomycetota bacterium]